MFSQVRSRLRSMSLQSIFVVFGGISTLIILITLLLSDMVGIPAAIITAAIPVSLSLAGSVISSDRQNRREIEAKLRERKSEVYEGFIKFWMDNLMIKENREKLQKNPNQVVRSMNEYSKAMMLWASNDVVQSYAEYKRRLYQITPEITGQSGIVSMIHFEKMIFLMREDLGHDPRGFRQYDLLSFFVNDIHKYDHRGNLIVGDASSEN